MISSDQLGQIVTWLSADPPGDALAAVIAEMRARIPGLVCMQCDAADVLEDPWRAYAAFDVHLVDGASHCPQLTDDPDKAGGLLFARKVLA